MKNENIAGISIKIDLMISISYTAQKMKFSIKDFFSKCDQIRRKLWIWSHLLKKFLMENIFCLVLVHEGTYTAYTGQAEFNYFK